MSLRYSKYHHRNHCLHELCFYHWLFIGIIALVLQTNDALGRQTDVRWLLQPDLEVKVIEAENVTLRWIYKKPPPTTNPGKVMFAHHVPGNNFEDMLIQGEVDPVMGHLSVKYAMFPDKVSMMCRGHEITVEIRDMRLSEYGRYMLDLKFDSDAAMHDVIDLSVFKSPSWTHTPHNEIHARTGDHVTMKWKRDMKDAQPEIQGITVVYNSFSEENDVTEVIRTSLVPGAGDAGDTWLTEYPEDGQRLSDRMLHEYSPVRDVFIVSLWDMELRDSGRYALRIDFEDSVTELEHSVDLHVVEGSTWKVHPGSDVFGVLSKNANLTYKPSIKNDTELSPSVQKYKLYKYRNRKEEEVMEVAVSEEGVTERRQRSINISQKIAVTQTTYGDQDFGILLTFTDIQTDHNGTYLLKMFLEDTMVVKHHFNFRVIQDNLLWPRVFSDSGELDVIQLPSHVTSPGMHSFRFPEEVPHPRVTMETGSGKDARVQADVSSPQTLTMWIEASWLDQGINVVVDYEFYRLSFQLSSAKGMSLSKAAFFHTLNQNTAEAVVVYITCFCLLAGNVLVLLVSCWIWRHHQRNKCHATCSQLRSADLQQRNATRAENVYEIPMRNFDKNGDDLDGVDGGFRNPRFRRPVGPTSPSDLDREALLPGQQEPTAGRLLEGSPSILRNGNHSPNDPSKRVRWEGLPKITYEQVEQHSPKLPRY